MANTITCTTGTIYYDTYKFADVTSAVVTITFVENTGAITGYTGSGNVILSGIDKEVFARYVKTYNTTNASDFNFTATVGTETFSIDHINFDGTQFVFDVATDTVTVGTANFVFGSTAKWGLN